MDISPEGRHCPDNFMSRDEPGFGLRELSVDDVKVRAANAASEDFDQDFILKRLG